MPRYSSANELVTASKIAPATAQAIAWRYEKWRSWLPGPTAEGPAWQRILCDLHDACTGSDCSITRTDVIAFGQMIASANFTETLSDIVHAVRTKGAAAGYDALWTSGRSRIRRLGPSYGTKLLFFAGSGHDVSPQPLVYDALVAKALAELEPRRWPLSPQLLATRQYADYCQWAANIAAACNVDPGEVEFSLFTYGASLPR